jgi:hypothetical protein
MLVRALVSLFWVVITDKKRREKYTLQKLADDVGSHKSEVSRWFSGAPNWQLKTVADIADALGLDLQIRAIDRRTGRVFAPSGEMIVPVIVTQSAPIQISVDPASDNTVTFGVGAFLQPVYLAA